MNSENKKLIKYMPMNFMVTKINSNERKNLKTVPPKYIFKKDLFSFLYELLNEIFPITKWSETINQPKIIPFAISV